MCRKKSFHAFLLKNLIPHDENSLYVFITQSGETSDTLKAIERVKKETKLPTLVLCGKILSIRSQIFYKGSKNTPPHSIFKELILPFEQTIPLNVNKVETPRGIVCRCFDFRNVRQRIQEDDRLL